MHAHPTLHLIVLLRVPGTLSTVRYVGRSSREDFMNGNRSRGIGYRVLDLNVVLKVVVESP